MDRQKVIDKIKSHYIVKEFLEDMGDSFESQMRIDWIRLVDYPISQWVDRGLVWSKTKEGSDYWGEKYHNWYLKAEREFPYLLDIEIPFLPSILSIGYEWEANPDNTNINHFHNDFKEFIFSHSWENSYIKELQIKPIDFLNFNQFLYNFLSISLLGGFKWSEGESDRYAGSGHTHIMFASYVHRLHKENEKIKNLLEWVDTNNTPFQKEIDKFRDAIIYRAEKNDGYLSCCSKEHRLTYNKDVGTLEFRINESPFPLWVYILSLIINGEDINYKNFKKWVKDKPIKGKTILLKTMEVYLNESMEALPATEFVLKNWTNSKWVNHYIPKIKEVNPSLTLI